MTKGQARIALGELIDLARCALERAGARPEAASSVAQAIARAEADGNAVCGLFYLPIFCEQLRLGRVDGHAVPEIASAEGGTVVVDARHGFAHPAFDLGLPRLIEAARRLGIAGLAIRNSYNALALGGPVETVAAAGLIALGFANAPASVAPPGSRRKIFGTNPLAFAAPGPDGAAILIDQSTSAVSKTEILRRQARRVPIPDGWAQDGLGNPTTDPAAALAGAILPSGGVKGGNVALIVEILSAALTGSTLSIHASPFSGPEGGKPGVGQFFVAIDPVRFAGDKFCSGLSILSAVLSEDPGSRLPGARRFVNRRQAELYGIAIDSALLNLSKSLAGDA